MEDYIVKLQIKDGVDCYLHGYEYEDGETYPLLGQSRAKAMVFRSRGLAQKAHRQLAKLLPGAGIFEHIKLNGGKPDGLSVKD